jgi:hypothetical protein
MPFIYLWYVAYLKKYYLGSTNGKDKYYTHSSTDKEFQAIVPHSGRPVSERREYLEKLKRGEIEGVSRKIIYRGDKEDTIRKIETDLLVNRHGRCWDRYFNYTNRAIGTETILTFIPAEGRILQPNGQYSFFGYHGPRRRENIPHNRRLERERGRTYNMRKKYGTDDDEIIYGKETLENFF